MRGIRAGRERHSRGTIHVDVNDLMVTYRALREAPVQKVVVVDGNVEILRLLEGLFESGRYDMVFVESSSRAYSQIRIVKPDLVVLCARFEVPDGFQLLTMLKLDPETRTIPVLTYTTEDEPGGEQAEPDDSSEFESLSLPRAASLMN